MELNGKAHLFNKSERQIGPTEPLLPANGTFQQKSNVQPTPGMTVFVPFPSIQRLSEHPGFPSLQSAPMAPISVGHQARLVPAGLHTPSDNYGPSAQNVQGDFYQLRMPYPASPVAYNPSAQRLEAVSFPQSPALNAPPQNMPRFQESGMGPGPFKEITHQNHMRPYPTPDHRMDSYQRLNNFSRSNGSENGFPGRGIPQPSTSYTGNTIPINSTNPSTYPPSMPTDHRFMPGGYYVLPLSEPQSLQYR
jgi:hypothetical protein